MLRSIIKEITSFLDIISNEKTFLVYSLYIYDSYFRYTFDADGRRSRLKELGPRFTLRLKSLQKGTFDSKYGEYEWILQGRRHDMETSRRKFFL